MHRFRFLPMAGWLTLTMGVTCFAADLSVGQQAELDDPTCWERWPSGLGNPSAGAAVEPVAEGLTFTVPEATHEMVWRRALRPVWLDFHHYLTIRYRVTGLPAQESFPLLRLRTASESWFTVFTSFDLQWDGNVHTQTVDL